MHVATLHVCKCCMELHLTSSAAAARMMQATSTSEAGYTKQASQVCSDSDTSCKVPHITPTFLPSGKHVEATCFFCNKPGDDLCQFITFQLTNGFVNVHLLSVTRTVLMGKLVTGSDNMIAYHPGCLLALYYV